MGCRYAIAGKWTETRIFDVRLKCGLQALRLNHLIKTSVAPKLKEATTSDASGPQIWVPLSQGEMKRKRRRVEGAGLSSAKGGGKGPGREKAVMAVGLTREGMAVAALGTGAALRSLASFG